MSKPPLWEVMYAARAAVTAKGAHCTTAEAQAAEIRALRDWLVPEEEPPTDDRLSRDWVTRMRLRDKLTAEADRAERGEGEHG